MGEREQIPLKTVTEFREREHPEKILIAHTSETGEEPAYVKGETLVAEEKLETGHVPHGESHGKLNEVVRDFYMFSLAPVYLTCLWDRAKNRIKVDLLYRFFAEMKKVRMPKIVHYQSEFPIFRGGLGVWDSFLQGLPREDNMDYLFPRWMQQLVFVNREVRPMEYWRVNVRSIRIMTPSLVSVPVDLAVFLPSGVDRRLELRMESDHTFSYVQERPEDWVIEEAIRYFGST